MDLMDVNKQWRSRPYDQRFLSLAEMEQAIRRRTENSREIDASNKDIMALVAGDQFLLNTPLGPAVPTHHSFSQLCSIVGAPASYLRTLPSDKVAELVNYGLEKAERTDNKFLCDVGETELRAITSTSYGRIWDLDVVRFVQELNADGRWVVPGVMNEQWDGTKKSTTLYASAHDSFIFLVDDKNPLDIGGDILYRGFIVSNSETGAAAFSVKLFTYRFVCANRIVWGANILGELNIRHYSQAPTRFIKEGQTLLAKFAERSVSKLENTIARAKTIELEGPDKSAVVWLKANNIPEGVAKKSIEAAIIEEGKAVTLWDVTQGMTAYARSIPYTDQRVWLERQAGRLLERYAA